MKAFKDMVTESDNLTTDFVRVLAFAAAVIGLVLQVWVVIRWIGPAPQVFDFQAFGIGLGGMFAGVGAALKLKPETQVEK